MRYRLPVVVLACIAVLIADCHRPSSPAPADPPHRVDLSSKSVEELIAMINDDPWELHFDITPAGDALIDRGPSVIPRVLDLMLSPGMGIRDGDGVLNITDDDATRMRAVRVLESVDGLSCFAP